MKNLEKKKYHGLVIRDRRVESFWKYEMNYKKGRGVRSYTEICV